MIIIRQQSEFVISGNIEAIKAELAKEPSVKPRENETGVFVGNFYPEIVYNNNQVLTLPASQVVLSGHNIGVRFEAGVCFFKDQDEMIYASIIDYINHIVKEELNKI